MFLHHLRQWRHIILEILRNTDTEAQNYVTNFFDILKFSKDFLLLYAIFFLLLVVDVYSTIMALIFLAFCIILYLLVFYNYLNQLGLRRLRTVNAVYQWTKSNLWCDQRN